MLYRFGILSIDLNSLDSVIDTYSNTLFSQKLVLHTISIMDLPNILNDKGPAAAAAAAEQQLQQHLAEATHSNGGGYSESGSDQGISPQSRSCQSLRALSNMGGAGRFPSPPRSQQSISLMPDSFIQPNIAPDNGFGNKYQHDGQQSDQALGGSRLSDNNGTVKAFACSTCQKGFARRSDLARHGMTPCSPIQLNSKPNHTLHRTNTHWCSSTRLRLPWLQ